jgi:hypothetical protein
MTSQALITAAVSRRRVWRRGTMNSVLSRIGRQKLPTQSHTCSLRLETTPRSAGSCTFCDSLTCDLIASWGCENREPKTCLNGVLIPLRRWVHMNSIFRCSIKKRYRISQAAGGSESYGTPERGRSLKLLEGKALSTPGNGFSHGSLFKGPITFKVEDS